MSFCNGEQRRAVARVLVRLGLQIVLGLVERSDFVRRTEDAEGVVVHLRIVDAGWTDDAELQLFGKIVAQRRGV